MNYVFASSFWSAFSAPFFWLMLLRYRVRFLPFIRLFIPPCFLVQVLTSSHDFLGCGHPVIFTSSQIAASPIRTCEYSGETERSRGHVSSARLAQIIPLPYSPSLVKRYSWASPHATVERCFSTFYTCATRMVPDSQVLFQKN